MWVTAANWLRKLWMNPLETYMASAEAHRGIVHAGAGALVSVIAYLDWKVPEDSIGYLYIAPILLVSAILRGWQIAAFAAVCGGLREAFSNYELLSATHPTPGAGIRVVVGGAGFALAGYFVSELNLKRRLMAQNAEERERQVQLRLEAQQQLNVVIETSPLAILILDNRGTISLANQSAQRLLGLSAERMHGTEIQAHLPILNRFLKMQRSSTYVHTSVESRGQREDGETFLAQVWLSTFATPSGRHLAAFIWDASENLRDREGAGLDSMMATSRILVGAVSHEIRNLAAAAHAAHRGLASFPGISQAENFSTLGSIIEGLEKLAASGLGLASHRATPITDLGMVLDEARVVVDASLRDSGCVVAWKIANGLPLVQADRHSLLQVFLNLARNSEHAMRDTRVRTLSVEAVEENDMIAVRFQDTGPGVARPDDLFKPFQPGAQATGLGLYISRAVLRSYGGDLRHEPTTQGGSFVVELWPVERQR
jgi:PAS domain S-box-containing protein